MLLVYFHSTVALPPSSPPPLSPSLALSPVALTTEILFSEDKPGGIIFHGGTRIKSASLSCAKP